MNLELIASLAFGVMVGLSLGIWRTWAYARKLIHFGISLDSWSDYSEAQRQAHGAASRAKTAIISPFDHDRQSGR